jgi:hypothetical protein
VFGWIERQVRAPSDTAFYRIEGEAGRDATPGLVAAARFISRRPAADDRGSGYNRRMSMAKRPDVESIPADLDRFLGAFFNSRDWRSEIKFDPAEDRLYLEVRLEDRNLSADDRFLSLVEYFARAQDAVLRQQVGLPLQCRLYASDGRELTTILHARGSSYLDDDDRGSSMRRRLAWLGFRRRFFVRVAPGALLWAAALVFVVGVVGVRLDVAVLIALLALGVQTVAMLLLAAKSR